MSTAIALQDMGLQSPTHGMRQRSTSKTGLESGDSAEERDEWLDTPHDTDSSNLPLESRPFEASKTYWITPHSLLTKHITILDLTADMNIQYSGLTDTYKDEVKKTLKDHSFTPAYTCERINWLGLRYNVVNDQGELIAEWKHPFSSVGEAVLSFPEDSPHSSHPIAMRNKRWGMRTESFTLNSQPFYWEMDSLWHSNYMTLYKIFGSGENERKVEVAKYANKWWGGVVTGGTLVVDERELDGFIASLTLCVVLKKKRQRGAERRNPGQ